MTGITGSTAGPGAWKYSLADPEKQWKALGTRDAGCLVEVILIKIAQHQID